MASVHESLYFNPMMTNGVVHANVFGIKDWVTPYKMALLVLLSELGRAGSQLGLLERRRLNRLLLPLLQVGDGPGGRETHRQGGRPQKTSWVVARRDRSLSSAGPRHASVATAQSHRGVLPAAGELRAHQVGAGAAPLFPPSPPAPQKTLKSEACYQGWDDLELLTARHCPLQGPCGREEAQSHSDLG